MQFEPVTGDVEAERKGMLYILEAIKKKKPALDITKAVNRQLVEEQSK